MTVVSAAITVTAIFASGVISGVVGLVTVAIHREEHHHTLIRPAPDHATSAARGLNGVYVHAPAASEARHRRQETSA